MKENIDKFREFSYSYKARSVVCWEDCKYMMCKKYPGSWVNYFESRPDQVNWASVGRWIEDILKRFSSPKLNVVRLGDFSRHIDTDTDWYWCSMKNPISFFTDELSAKELFILDSAPIWSIWENLSPFSVENKV